MREAGSLVSIGTLLAFVIVSIGVLALRLREPELPRTFKTPAVWCRRPDWGRCRPSALDDLTTVANVGAADLLVCVRHRDLLRLQRLQLQTWPSENPR